MKNSLEFVKTHQLKTLKFCKSQFLATRVILMELHAKNEAEKLIFIDGIMKHMIYLDILNNDMKENTINLDLGGVFIFY